MSLNVYRVLLTGAPYGGKSSTMEWICNEYKKRGFRVICVKESATEVLKMIEGATPPYTREFHETFQRCVAVNQILRERVAEAVAEIKHTSTRTNYCEFVETEDMNVIIVVDRSIMDGKIFYEGDFNSILGELSCDVNLNTFREDGLPGFDCILHLESLSMVGIYKEETSDTETCRIHSAQESWGMDRRFTELFSTHTNYKFIPAFNERDVRNALVISIIDQVIQHDKV